MSDARPAERSLVLGVGNPILGDDGAGWRVVERVAEAVAAGHAGRRPETDCVATGGLALMERMVGYDRAILVDAIHGSGDPPGTVRVWPVESIPGREASHLDSAHDVPIVVALATGSALGATLPRRIEVVSVEATAVATFSEVLTPEVEAAIPVAAGAVLRLLADDRDGHCRLPTGAADLAATGQGA